MRNQLLLTLLLLSGIAQGATDAGAQYFSCRSCHGDTGLGSPAIHAPALAGQSRQYIARQLRNFKNGVRGENAQDTWGRQMALMAANLDEAAINSLSEFIAALPPWPSGGKKVQKDTDSAQLFASCAVCHGKAGEGKAEMNAPRIGGLDSTYLANQLRNFRSGIRGSAKEDSYGQQMRSALPSALDDDALEKLAHYIQGL